MPKTRKRPKNFFLSSDSSHVNVITDMSLVQIRSSEEGSNHIEFSSDVNSFTVERVSMSYKRNPPPLPKALTLQQSNSNSEAGQVYSNKTHQERLKEQRQNSQKKNGCCIIL
jgi:hypothetical protein